jgi:hypothetical protein
VRQKSNNFIQLTINENKRIIYTLNTTIMSECKQCNQKPVSKGQYLTIIFGIYLLGSSIYGTIQIIKNLISLF